MFTDVFFDFFGTLVDYDASVHPPGRNAPYEFSRRAGVALARSDSDALWEHCWDELERRADRTGVEHSMHDVANRYWELIGSPRIDDRAMDELIAEYLEAWTGDIVLADAAIECVMSLAADHRLTVVSNTHDAALVPSQLRRFGLDDHITAVVTSIEVGWRKPHPNIFRAALAHHGIDPSDAVFVGDDWRADVEGPRRAGMTSFFVGEPAENRPAVSLRELPELIRSSDLSRACGPQPAALP